MHDRRPIRERCVCDTCPDASEEAAIEDILANLHLETTTWYDDPLDDLGSLTDDDAYVGVETDEEDETEGGDTSSLSPDSPGNEDPPTPNNTPVEQTELETATIGHLPIENQSEVQGEAFDCPDLWCTETLQGQIDTDTQYEAFDFWCVDLQGTSPIFSNPEQPAQQGDWFDWSHSWYMTHSEDPEDEDRAMPWTCTLCGCRLTIFELEDNGAISNTLLQGICEPCITGRALSELWD